MTTTLDIIDTAVKIGLGAAISGITAYFIGKAKQRHGLKKDMLFDKNELLKECAFKLDKCGSMTNHVHEEIQNVRRTTDNKSKELLTDEMSKLTDAFNEAKEARSIAFLIGERELADLIEGYLDNEEQQYHHYRTNLLKYDINFINSKPPKVRKLNALF